MSKLVSILLPTHNGADRIKEAMASVFGQFYDYWELLVLDDGSVDDTKQIVESLAKDDSRVKYIKNETNLGIQKALNKGLREAKGEYIARIDDDDVWIDKDKLKKQVEFLDKNKDYVLIGTGVIVIDENKKELFRYLPPQEDNEIRNKILYKNCFTHSSVLFRKNVAFEFGGYSEDPNVKHIEDYDLWLKLGTMGKFANLRTYSIVFTQRGGAISAKNRVVQAKRSLYVIKKFKNKYPRFFRGYFITLIKLWFFAARKMIPISEKMLSKFKAQYKEF
ncbi:MAG: glycosyltransferase family 2 protein [Patescibacteria group bacterium]